MKDSLKILNLNVAVLQISVSNFYDEMATFQSVSNLLKVMENEKDNLGSPIDAKCQTPTAWSEDLRIEVFTPLFMCIDDRKQWKFGLDSDKFH